MATVQTPHPERVDSTERDVDATIRDIFEEAKREPLPPALLALVQRLSGRRS